MTELRKDIIGFLERNPGSGALKMWSFIKLNHDISGEFLVRILEDMIESKVIKSVRGEFSRKLYVGDRNE